MGMNVKQASVRIFKSRWFARFAHKERIGDAKLCEAVREADKGNIDADYGGGVIKQRIARLGQGKSGGYRSIIYYRQGNKAFYIYGFSKKDRDNIADAEVREFKKQARLTLALSDSELAKLIANETYQEVNCHEEKSDNKG